MRDVFYANPKKASGMLGIGTSRIYELLATGELKAVKCGRSTLLDIPHALEWLRKQPAARISYGNSSPSKAV